MFYNAQKDSSSKQNIVYDLTCKKDNIISIVAYDKNNKIIDSWSSGHENYQSIVPETWSEAIFKFCKTA